MLMKGKRGLVVGVANKWSIAWGITQALAAEGAELALTYQNERLGKNVRELAETLDKPLLIPMDVTSDKQILLTFELLKHGLCIQARLHAIDQCLTASNHAGCI